MLIVFWSCQYCFGTPGQRNVGEIRQTSSDGAKKSDRFTTTDEMVIRPDSSAFAKNRVILGLKAGLTWCWLYSTKRTIIQRKYPLGYSVGLAAEISLCRQLGISSGLNFSLERQNYAISTPFDDDWGIWYRLTSQNFDVPLGLKIYPFATQCITLNTGIQFRTVIKSKQEIEHIFGNGQTTKRNKTQYWNQSGNGIHFYCSASILILRRPIPLLLEMQYLIGLTDYKNQSFLHDYSSHSINLFMTLQPSRQ